MFHSLLHGQIPQSKRERIKIRTSIKIVSRNPLSLFLNLTLHLTFPYKKHTTKSMSSPWWHLSNIVCIFPLYLFPFFGNFSVWRGAQHVNCVMWMNYINIPRSTEKALFLIFSLLFLIMALGILSQALMEEPHCITL